MDEMLRLRVARRVAHGDRAWELDGQNGRSAQRLGLEAAVAGGHAFMVVPRTDLLVVDLDLPAAGSAGVVSAFDALLERARQAGVSAAAVESGRPGHRHAFLVVGPAGPDRMSIEAWCRRHGLDVRNLGIRPPGAPHRSGTPSPLTSEQAGALLEALAVEADGVSTTLLARALGVRLPQRVLRAVREGHVAAGYASASNARMALAVAVVSRGGGVGLLEHLLRDRGNVLSASFLRRDGVWQAAELGRLVDKARAWVASGGRRKDARRRLAAVLLTAHSDAWRGQAGGSDLAVLEELVRVGARHGVLEPAASMNEIAIGAGVAMRTARRAVNRLRARGWLDVAASPTARTSTHYRLLVPDDLRSSGTAGLTLIDIDDLLGADVAFDLGADHGRGRGGLGKGASRVLRALRRLDAVTTAGLASVLRMPVASVRIFVRRLIRAGFALREGLLIRGVNAGSMGLALGALRAFGERARQIAQYREVLSRRVEARLSYPSGRSVLRT